MDAVLENAGLSMGDMRETITSRDIVHCPQCYQALGVLLGDLLVIAHAGRTIRSTLPVFQVCHRCKCQTSTGGIIDLTSNCSECYNDSKEIGTMPRG